MEEQIGTKKAGKYCQNCGKLIDENAAICPHCGVAVKGGVLDRPKVSKDKTVALLLAIFLSFWTWIYTYEKDSWKFWLNLALSIVTLGFWAIAATIWAIIDVATKPDSYYINYPNG
ncbi:MAG: hypothetical protein A2Z35_03890 [Actinobacteria bacterium RBG_19FT_COMBO_36_27]|nr:MAG: hypothetical protein A2Z35_03890 [Actinobacteria bacterium RBG_19FT_COMBO_36_27]